MAISLLFPVVSTIHPRAFESAMSRTPRIRHWRFSSVSPAGCRRVGVEAVGERPVGRLDGAVSRSIPRLAASASASVTEPSRVARRHGHPVHVAGTHGVDGDRGDQRGVDAARQPDDGVGEPFFAR